MKHSPRNLRLSDPAGLCPHNLPCLLFIDTACGHHNKRWICISPAPQVPHPGWPRPPLPRPTFRVCFSSTQPSQQQPMVLYCLPPGKFLKNDGSTVVKMMVLYCLAPGTSSSLTPPTTRCWAASRCANVCVCVTVCVRVCVCVCVCVPYLAACVLPRAMGPDSSFLLVMEPCLLLTLSLTYLLLVPW